jgi:hypothetical protein
MNQDDCKRYANGGSELPKAVINGSCTGDFMRAKPRKGGCAENRNTKRNEDPVERQRYPEKVIRSVSGQVSSK